MKKKELIVITGAGQGIGAYLARKLSKDYFVLLISKSLNSKKISLEINKIHPLSADYLILDLEEDINIELLKKKIEFDKFSNVHLIFCAGYVEDFNFKIDVREWKKVFNINLFSHLEIFNFFVDPLKKIKKAKNIIFFSGGGAANSFSTFPAYSASKTAIVRTVENLSLNYEKFGFNIFAIAPGAIKTKMLEKVLKNSNVGTRTTKKEVFQFIKYYFVNNSQDLNGKLVHIRDDKTKINKNDNINYLKLRRIE